MKKIMMGLAGMVYTSAFGQNVNNAIPNNSTNNANVPPLYNCSYVNPNYDHSPSYSPVSNCNTTSNQNTTITQETPIENEPINSNNNNNTMSPFTNTVSPYDNTSPYYTPPNANAPLNNTPPEK